ncbi:MAG: I78 family peptidase inhibitor [Pseudomonadota bacterium]
MTIKPVYLLAPMALCAASAMANAQPATSLCAAGPAQSFVGGPATQDTGAAIRAATGATIFQWVFEGSPVTMDYREDRVRVFYNRDMRVIDITCG